LFPHVAGVEEEIAVRTGGSVMLNVTVAVHPLASVTVQVYVPAVSEAAVEAVPPAGDHE
jgi:hypothetical protein